MTEPTASGAGEAQAGKHGTITCHLRTHRFHHIQGNRSIFVGWALPFNPFFVPAVNDNADETDDVTAVLATHADRISFTIWGDDALAAEYDRVFRRGEIERADSYAYAVTSERCIPLDFHFAREVYSNA